MSACNTPSQLFWIQKKKGHSFEWGQAIKIYEPTDSTEVTKLELFSCLASCGMMLTLKCTQTYWFIEYLSYFKQKKINKNNTTLTSFSFVKPGISYSSVTLLKQIHLLLVTFLSPPSVWGLKWSLSQSHIHHHHKYSETHQTFWLKSLPQSHH